MNRLYYYFVLFYLSGIFSSCGCNNDSAISSAAYQEKRDSVTYRLLFMPDNTYGFDILLNGKIYIHQPFIPCWQDFQHFINASEASAVAKLIVARLGSNNFKFLLQKFEIDSLLGVKERYVKTASNSSPPNSNANIIAPATSSDTGMFISEIIPLLPEPPINNKWTTKGIVPFGYRSGGFTFVIGKNVYIGSGEVHDEIIRDMWSYNTVSETWTCLAEMPAKCFSGFAFSIFNKGYVGLGTEIGTSSGKFEKHVYQYDPLLNSWKIKNDFPGTGRIDVSFFVIGEKGYVGSGYDGSNAKDFYEYDPLKDRWKQIADFAGGGVHAAVGISNGQRGFIVGGARAPKSFKFVYEYIPSLNKWQKRQDLPAFSRTFLSGNYIDSAYLIAGAGGTYEINKRLRDFYVYSIKENLWTKAADYPCDINGSTRAISGNVDGKVYMGTGFGEESLHDWNMYEYYFSVRTDTGTYNETVCYPLNYNGSWELYQECTGTNCYAGAAIKSTAQLGNFCYKSDLSGTGKNLSLKGSNGIISNFILLPRRFNISAEIPFKNSVGLRLFFTRNEMKTFADFEKPTGSGFDLEKVKILQYNGPNQDLQPGNNSTDINDYTIISPQLYSYGFQQQIIVTSFNVTRLSSEFYLALQVQ